MLIPVNEQTGYRTVSASMLATYGYGSFGMDELAEARGCPRQFQAKYTVPKDQRPPSTEPQLNGKVKHAAIAKMEADDMGPEEALAAVWDPALSTERYEEALADLRNYIERESTPLDRYMLIANERWLAAELYVDEEYGPIWYQGIADRISADQDTPNLLHIGDWKFVNNPPSTQDVKESDQLKGYHFLVAENWQELGLFRQPKIVVHLDAVKWYELPPVHFTDAQIEAWKERTISIVKQILRDEEAKPVLNWGCAYCPVRDTCPEYLRTPDIGLALLQVRPPQPLPQHVAEDGTELAEPVMPTREEMLVFADQLARWAMKVNTTRLLLENQFKDVNGRFTADAKQTGLVIAGGIKWERELAEKAIVDMRGLHVLVDDEIYDRATITEAELKALAAAHPEIADKILALRYKVPNGVKVTRKKA